MNFFKKSIGLLVILFSINAFAGVGQVGQHRFRANSTTTISDFPLHILGTYTPSTVRLDVTGSNNTYVFRATQNGAGIAGLFEGILQTTHHLQFNSGAAIVTSQYEVGRDTAGTNNLYLNAPTSAAINSLVAGVNIFSVDGSGAYLKKGMRTNRTEASGDYSVTLTDFYIGVTSTSSPWTITLPSAVTAGEGKHYIVKDESGGAGSNNITINSSGSSIDGASLTLIDSGYGSLSFISDGFNWFIY